MRVHARAYAFIPCSNSHLAKMTLFIERLCTSLARSRLVVRALPVQVWDWDSLSRNDYLGARLAC
eukprot:6197587-Pleurochrysis_carterae.AAC.2